MYGKWLTVFLAVVLVFTADSVEISGRIVGGQEITIDKAPYVVRLKHARGHHVCGGTLVTSQHVVTAAHCLRSNDPIKDLSVVAGVSSLSEEGQERKIAKYYKPEFNRDRLHTDYAVLKLSAPIPESPTTKPIPLCSTNLKPSDIVQVSGFGLYEGGGRLSQKLRTVFVPAIRNSQCSLLAPLTNTMFCTLSPTKGTCRGDSGGPLVYKGELCGIASRSPQGCDYSTGAPAIFTDVKVIIADLEKAITNL